MARDSFRRLGYWIAFYRRLAAGLRLGLERETIAEHVLRNVAIKQGRIFVWKLKPGQPPGQPGSLADLQEARATTILLIKRNDNHSEILGEITREIKRPKQPAPFCR